MKMKTIEVPDYVAEQFAALQENACQSAHVVNKSAGRVFKLASHALSGVSNPEWEINDGMYHSPTCNEPLGLHKVDNKFIIYGEERGRRDVLAIFKSCHMAAEYFVWLVSKGKREIDWGLFLDMEL